MGKFVGGITDAIGLTDNKGEKRAAAAAAEASAQGYALSKEQIQMAKDELQFQKDQYQDWKNVYGDIQENLGDYYKTLTPEKITTLGLENQQKEYQAVQAAIERDLTQRGLTGSGIEAKELTSAAVSNAVARAQIRSTAEDTATEKKMQFLSLGLGQGTQMLGTIANSASNVTGAYSSAVANRTSTANAYLNTYSNLATTGMSNMGKIASAAATGYLQK